MAKRSIWAERGKVKVHFCGGRDVGKFSFGNQIAAREKWNLFEIHGFQKHLRELKARLNYTNEDLAKALDYSTDYIHTLLGDYSRLRKPSPEVLRRLQAFEQTNPQAKPAFAPVLAFDPGRAYVALSQVLAKYRQCPECVHEMKKGFREESLTWWVMKVPRQKYHSIEHRRAAQSRRRHAAMLRRKHKTIDQEKH